MLNNLSASQQAALIRRRDVSVRELLDAHIAAIEQHNATINAFITLDLSSARARADALDAQHGRGAVSGALFGLPIGIKDSAPVAGLRFTRGSRAFADDIATVNAAHVDNLLDAGAIVLGKTNLPELGHGRHGGQTDNAIAGLTRNPLNPAKTVGSSSGGSAAALAANFVALADGSDIAGSIRGPAAWCGLYGLRPTSGVVPYWPKDDPFNGTDVVGPLARTAADLRMMFDAMRSPRKASLFDTATGAAASGADASGAAASGTLLQGLRVAWCMAPAGAQTSDPVISALAPLRHILTDAGAVVIDAEPEFSGLHAAQAQLRQFGVFVKHGERIAAAPALFSDELCAACAAGRGITTETLASALRTRDHAVHTLTRFFASVDVMVWPSSTALPFDAEATADAIHEDWTPLELTPVLQVPALSIPVGTTPDGMPCGAQLIGPKRSDLQLIEMARLLEPALGLVQA